MSDDTNTPEKTETAGAPSSDAETTVREGATRDPSSKPEPAPSDEPEVTRASLEKLPEAMNRDELVALIRRAKLAEQIDLRLSAPKLLAALFDRRADLRPPPDPEVAKAAADRDELAKRAEEGDDDAAAALAEIDEREAAEQRAALGFARELERAKPALPWLSGFGFTADPSTMARAKLLEALLAAAGTLEEPPSAVREAAERYLALAMAIVGEENREIVLAHRQGVISAVEAERSTKATTPKVRHYRVERAARYVRDGVVYNLGAGVTVTSKEYSIEELKKQGVPLAEIAAPRSK
jgi:hypothetical protein